MIEKMKFVSITGPREDIDRVSEQYLSRYEIHLENALSELKTKENLSPFVESDPYSSAQKEAESLLEFFPAEVKLPKKREPVTSAQALQTVSDLSAAISELKAAENGLKEERDQLLNRLQYVAPYRHMEFDIPAILEYKFIKFRFGRIPRDYYQKFSEYVYDNLDAVFIKGETDDEYVWGVYFTSRVHADKTDTIFTSLHFERIYLPDGFESTPKDACRELTRILQQMNEQIEKVEQKILAILEENQLDLAAAQERLEEASKCFNVRKLAACTDKHEESHYILCGWMSEKDALAFQKASEKDNDVCLIVEDDQDKLYSTPPTKLKNFRLFRPFEMFVEMYGLPDYNESDPTPLVALTYAFTFGVMFGDVGQGLFLILAGMLIYRRIRHPLAAIIAAAGIFSTFFGFMFGSFFGFEDILEARWLHPAQQMSTLPFIGRLNTIFIVAIAFGMVIIVTTMILNISNGIRTNQTKEVLFDPNGFAGLVFYGSLLLVIVLFMTENTLPGTLVLVLMFGVPLLLIALKEPLTKVLEHRKDYMPESIGMFVVETFFELFEMLLSYFSNTLSFVRVGAFAVSHAAMMEVVLMLAGAEQGGSPSWIVVILGNLFVIGMEGLIVGIQVLRLEYYEMFSRFYKGGGRKFEPYLEKTKKR